MKKINEGELAWEKMAGLLPAIIQDAATANVLMLGYMTPEALALTQDTGLVTFYSRSKQRLWTKGEKSGNQLKVLGIQADCDGDSILIFAEPTGPTCHRGTRTCFGEESETDFGFLAQLQKLLMQRYKEQPAGSYTTSLFQAGDRRVAQKVGEEGVEVALAAVSQDKIALCSEAADLLFHLLVLLQMKQCKLSDCIDNLKQRYKKGSQAQDGKSGTTEFVDTHC